MTTSILCNPARSAIMEAAKATGLSHSRIYGTCKTTRVVQTRWACMLVLRRMGLSFPEIAAEFGMHHTTVMHGCCKATALLKTDSWFRALVDHLTKPLS